MLIGGKLMFEWLSYIVLTILIIIGLFKYCGEKWIENKFKMSLESYKNEQTKSLEELKFKINTLFNRVTKIHEKEFEVLPEAWNKLQDALGMISTIVSPTKRYTRFEDMSDEGIKEFVAKSRLNEFEKVELLRKENKIEMSKFYKEALFWHELPDVEDDYIEFHNYIIRNRIFLTDDLHDKFKQVDKIMNEALISRRISEEAKDHKLSYEAYEMIKRDVDPIVNEIETLVQKRLHYKEVE